MNIPLILESRLFITMCLAMLALTGNGLCQTAPVNLRPKLSNIQSIDHRVIANVDQYPFSSIGRLNIRSFGHCTASVIGPRTILTAAHCLFNQRTHNIAGPQALFFVLAKNRDSNAGVYTAESIQLSRGSMVQFLHQSSLTTDRLDINDDWALIILDRNIAAQPIPIKSLSSDEWKIYSSKAGSFERAGFSGDRPEVMTVHIGCKAIKSTWRLNAIEHDCDTVSGDSGSPLLLIDEPTPFIVGIVNQIEKREGGKGYAVSATSFYAAIQEWIK